ncbi:/ / hypothetical protein / 224339:225352 Forward [Candidatus Hepatoplasma crinochetorum]|uniref:Uncharacterized protein n=1 Tax=Candidatus Hepatoplasma crinochetorum TaxID=295596 RepID=A0A0G7ZKW0_9MOLU|nr:/ / hypothetical protein / 224339:225352 Forward [Candidatus Hepatoplasma crinochetorum]
MIEDKKFYKELILENLYSSINNYNDMKNNFSFVFFISEIHRAYTFLFISILEIREENDYKKYKNNQSKTPNFLYLANRVYEKYLSEYGKENKNLIPKFKKNMENLNSLRGTYYHNPFPDEKNINSFYFEFYKYDNADQFLKEKFKSFTESLIANYIFICDFFFDIKIAKFSFINSNSLISNSKILEEKFNKNKNLKKIYDYYFTKIETLINIDDYFGSQALLKKILEEIKNLNFKYYKTYLNKDGKITGNGAYYIYYSLQISNEFIKNNNIYDDEENWIKKHYFPNNKDNELNAKGYNKSLIPYIKYIIDHYPRSYLVKNYKEKSPFSFDNIKKWDI